MGAPAPLPVLLTNLARVVVIYSSPSRRWRDGRTPSKSRTNLTAGAWVNLTNFTGDGSLKQFIFPATNPPVRFFRVQTQ